MTVCNSQGILQNDAFKSLNECKTNWNISAFISFFHTDKKQNKKKNPKTRHNNPKREQNKGPLVVLIKKEKRLKSSRIVFTAGSFYTYNDIKAITQRGERNGCFPSRVQVSASFSRGEGSCRRGGSAGRKGPQFSRTTHPVRFSKSAPSQSPPQYTTVTQRVFSRQWGQIGVSNMQVYIVGVGEEFLHEPTGGRRRPYFPFCVRHSAPASFIRSPVPALGVGTRGRREWRSARKACCATQRRNTQPELFEKHFPVGFSKSVKQ